MKYIILCGGIGKRYNDYSLPKPLNYIRGKHLIEYIIENIPSNDIYIIYYKFLDSYNFREIVINKCKNKTIHFCTIDYLTRGAVETAYIGVQNFDLEDDNILFIDNDNLHEYPTFEKYDKNFICYGINYVNTNYSFITINNNRVTNIIEKEKISNFYCCGLYGFQNKKSFLENAKNLLLNNNKFKNEFYFSVLYKLLLDKNENILPVIIKNTTHIGTFDELSKYDINNHINNTKKLRICFDLDNTLVTYPSIPGDYTTVKPIEKNIDLLNYFKNQNCEIIIYTARRMQTHHGNVGRVIKDIGIITFNTLEKFNIYYDEIIFGKPIADIYIDDRAINPFYNEISLFGFFNKIKKFIPNKIENNKYNQIEYNNNIIYKKGPEKFMRGELYFYQTIPEDLKYLFPNLHKYDKFDSNIELNLEYIKGIPLYFLLKNELLTTKNIDKLFDILNKLHNHDYPITINESLVRQNYIDKLKERFNKIDYYFDDAENILDNIIEEFNQNLNYKIVPIIHGDFWFSNIIMEYNDEIKLLDMKGQVYNYLTLNGDMYYDYGKMYQSILGYDLIINNCNINKEYLKFLENYFLEKCNKINLDIKYLKCVTKSLIFGTFHSLNINVSKENIWNLIKSI